MKAWGIKTWKGKLIHNGEERRIPGVNSAGWVVLEDALVFEQQRFPQLSPDLQAAELLKRAANSEASL